MRISALLVAILLAIPFVAAATIHGTVYNIDLNPVKNAKVELDNPHQVFIAVNGTYQFEVAAGQYTLSAKLIQNGTTTASTTEQVNVANDGDYVLDLILLPDLGDTTFVDESDTLDIDEVDTLSTPALIMRVIIGLIIVSVLLAYFIRKKSGTHTHHSHENHDHVGHTHEQHAHAEQHPAHTDADVENIIKIIKEQGNRTTQKDIRKQTPLSEAKVSLIITELEHKGVIEKIKKGRANIIILKP